MTIEYEYDAARQTLTVRPRGVLGLSDIRDYFEEMSTDRDVGIVRLEVVDFEGVTDFGYSYSDVYALRRAYDDIMRKRKRVQRTVLLASGELQFGMARMTALAFGDEMPVVVCRSVEEIDGLPKAADISNHA